MSDDPRIDPWRCLIPVLPSRLPCMLQKGHKSVCRHDVIAADPASAPRASILDESIWRHPGGTQRAERPNVDEAIIARLRRIRAAIPEMTRPLALHVEEVDALLAAVDERDELRRQVCDMPDEVAERRAAAVQALREEAERRGLPPITTAGEIIAAPRVVRCECREDYMCWAHGCGVLQPGETETTR